MPRKPPVERSPLTLLRDELHSLFADVPALAGAGRIAVDVVDEPRWVEIRFDMLALAPDDLEVEMEGDMLRLKGSRLVETDETERGSRHHRRRRWHFTRAVQLPDVLAPQRAVATYHHGLLTVRVAKRKPPQG